MRNARALSLLAVLVVLGLSLPAAATLRHKNYLPLVQAQGGTQLPVANSGFEGGYYLYGGAAELKVANDWAPWWDEASTRPEFKIADPTVDPRRVRTGNGAQQWFNNYATHTAGIYQQVSNVPFDTPLKFEAWVQAFSSSQDNFDQSAGKYRMRIGVDPYGGTDPESPDVVWSNGGHAIEPYDQFYYLSVETTARSDRVTLFIWGQAEWALKHNNAYVDDVRLYMLDGSVTPTPPPGSTLTEEQIRAIVRDEMAKTLRAMADQLEQ